MKIIELVLSVIAPHDCLGCGAEGVLLCAACRGGLVAPQDCCYKCHAPSPGFRTCAECLAVSRLRAVLPAVKYEALAKDVVWKLKFGRAKHASREIADIIADRLRLANRQRGRTSIMTHAPTAMTRIRQRGYDQSALVAAQLARGCGLPYSRLLVRRGSQKQIGASRLQRSSQLSGAFRVIRPSRVRGAHIILVDDVVTTGATLEAAADALMAAGARRVDAVVFAQAQPAQTSTRLQI